MCSLLYWIFHFIFSTMPFSHLPMFRAEPENMKLLFGIKRYNKIPCVVGLSCWQHILVDKVLTFDLPNSEFDVRQPYRGGQIYVQHGQEGGSMRHLLYDTFTVRNFFLHVYVSHKSARTLPVSTAELIGSLAIGMISWSEITRKIRSASTLIRSVRTPVVIY